MSVGGGELPCTEGHCSLPVLRLCEVSSHSELYTSPGHHGTTLPYLFHLGSDSDPESAYYSRRQIFKNWWLLIGPQFIKTVLLQNTLCLDFHLHEKNLDWWLPLASHTRVQATIEILAQERKLWARNEASKWAKLAARNLPIAYCNNCCSPHCRYPKGRNAFWIPLLRVFLF